MSKKYSGDDYQNRGVVVNAPTYAFNAYLDAGTWKYKSTNFASKIEFDKATGILYIYTAPSGTIDTAITWTARQVLKQDGNFGLGLTNPATKFDVRSARVSGADENLITLSDAVTGTQTAGFGCRIQALSNGGNSISAIGLEQGGTGTNNESQIQLYTQSAGGGLTSRLKINHVGVVELLTGQLKFPATANPSSDANTLDDYQEATWTPADGSGAGLVIGVSDARVTKVGNFFVCRMDITYPVTASTAVASISGVPFPCESGNAMFLSPVLDAFATPIQGLIADTDTVIQIYNNGTAVQNVALSGKRISVTFVQPF